MVEINTSVIDGIAGSDSDLQVRDSSSSAPAPASPSPAPRHQTPTAAPPTVSAPTEVFIPDVPQGEPHTVEAPVLVDETAPAPVTAAPVSEKDFSPRKIDTILGIADMTFAEKTSGMAEYTKDNTTLGSVPIVRHQGLRGPFYMSIKGEMDDEQVLAEIEQYNSARLEQLAKRTQDYETKLGYLHWASVAGAGAQMTPYALAGGGARAVGGAAGGLLTGGATLALTKNPAAAMAAARTGTAAGSTALGGAYIMEVETVNLWADMRTAKTPISNEIAVPLAVIGGVASGFIEFWQLSSLSAVGRREFAKQLRGGKFTKEILRFTTNLLKESAMQGTQEAGQELTQITVEYLATWLESGREAPTREEMSEALIAAGRRTAQASSSAMKGGLALGGASHLTGATLGKAAHLAKSEKLAQGLEMVDRTMKVLKSSNIGAKRLFSGKVKWGELKQLGQAFLEEAQHPVKEKEKRDAALARMEEMGDEAATAEALDLMTTEAGTLTQSEGQVQEAVLDELVTAEDGTLTAGVQKTSEEVAAEEQAQLEVSEESEAEDMTVREATAITAEEVIEQKALKNQIRYWKGERQKAVDAKEDTTVIDEQIADLEAQQKQVVEDTALGDGVIMAIRGQQIDKAIRDIDRELEDLNREFEEREDQEQPTKAIQNKIDKLEAKRLVLDQERALINEGLLTVEEIGTTQIGISGAKLARIQAKNTLNLMKALEEGLRLGEKASRNKIRDIQGQVIQFIKQSGLSLNDQAKFITAVKNIQTSEQLESQLPVLRQRVEKLAEADYKRRGKARIEKATKAFTPDQRSKKPVSKFPADVQSKMDLYTKHLGDKEAAAKRLEELQKKASREELTVDEEVEMAIAGQAVAAADGTGATLDYVANAMENLLAFGRVEALEKANLRRELKAERMAEAEKSALGNRELPKSTPSIGEQRKFWLENVIAGSLHYDSIIELISEHDKARKLKEIMSVQEAVENEITNVGANLEMYSNGLIDIVMGANENASLWRLWRTGLLKKVPGIGPWVLARNVLKRLIQDDKVNILVRFTNKKGKAEKVMMSKAQIRAAITHTMNAETRAQMKEGGLDLGGDDLDFTTNDDVSPDGLSLEQALENELDDVDRAIINYNLEFFKEYYERVNKEYIDAYGAPLPFIENYFPRITTGLNRSFAEQVLEDVRNRVTVAPSSVKSRVENSGSVNVQKGDVSAVTKHIIDTEHWAAWRGTIQRLSDVMSSARFKRIVERRYGKAMLKRLEDNIQYFVTDRHRLTEQYLTGVEWFRKNLLRAKLGGKFGSQIFKQTMSIFAYIDHVGAKDFVTGLNHLLEHPDVALETMLQAPPIKDRWGTFSQEMRHINDTGNMSEFRKHFDMDSFWGLGTKIGDFIPVVGGHIVYQHEIKKGKTHAEALAIASEAVNNTQQSRLPQKQNAWQQGHPFMRLMSTFLSSVNQYMQIEYLSYRRLAHAIKDAVDNKPGAKEDLGLAIRGAAKKFAVYHIILPVTFRMASEAFMFGTGGDPDEDDPVWARYARTVVLGNLDGWILIGPMLSHFATLGMNLAMGIRLKAGLFDKEDLLAEELVNEPTAFITEAIKQVSESGGDIDIMADALDNSDREKLIKKAAVAADIIPLPFGIGTVPTETMYKAANMMDKAGQQHNALAVILARQGWSQTAVQRFLEPDQTDVDLGEEAVGEQKESPLGALLGALTGGLTDIFVDTFGLTPAPKDEPIDVDEDIRENQRELELERLKQQSQDDEEDDIIDVEERPLDEAGAF